MIFKADLSTQNYPFERCDPMQVLPKLSIIMATYNRAHTLTRAIDSVLRQDYPNWELIIVDDGSTDNTAEVLAQYQDEPRIRVVRHSENRGVTAAKNTGLDSISGEWFTFLDSDDELTPDALSTMIGVLEMDPEINAITCNCVDSVTGKFTGLGLDHDQYLDLPTMVQRCRGEHWGLTRVSLLGGLRFNDKIPSESVLWYKISRSARRYYIHKGLRIYHTEGQDRHSRPSVQRDLSRKKAWHYAMQEETEYLEILRQYRPAEYANIMFNLAVFSLMDGKREDAVQASRCLRGYGSWPRIVFVWSGLLLGACWTKALYRLVSAMRFPLRF
jgi:glycosyltransferase involved in cell wall biosynthesis